MKYSYFAAPSLPPLSSLRMSVGGRIRRAAGRAGQLALGGLGILGNAAMVGSFIAPTADVRAQEKIVARQEKLLKKQEELAKKGIITSAVIPDDKIQPPDLSPNSLRDAMPPKYTYR